VKPTVTVEPLDNINDIFARLKAGKVDGRIVVTP
jgi:alcohol dehydrogenase, propanol-preferring